MGTSGRGGVGLRDRFIKVCLSVCFGVVSEEFGITDSRVTGRLHHGVYTGSSVIIILSGVQVFLLWLPVLGNIDGLRFDVFLVSRLVFLEHNRPHTVYPLGALHRHSRWPSYPGYNVCWA
jgi:hypothetical protein